MATKVGHFLAKVFSIKLDYRQETEASANISRGESVFSVSSADTYVEEEPPMDKMPNIGEVSKAVIEFTCNRCPRQFHQF